MLLSFSLHNRTFIHFLISQPSLILASHGPIDILLPPSWPLLSSPKQLLFQPPNFKLQKPVSPNSSACHSMRIGVTADSVPAPLKAIEYRCFELTLDRVNWCVFHVSGDLVPIRSRCVSFPSILRLIRYVHCSNAITRRRFILMLDNLYKSRAV